LFISPEQAKLQPKTLIVNAEVDPSRDDGILFGELLQKHGVEVAILTMHGVLHDSLVWEATRGGETAKVVLGAVVVGIKEALREDTEETGTKRKSSDEVEGRTKKTRVKS
jgi:acetyl esterase